MRFGLSFPNFGQFADPALLVELARVAEHAGWDGFFVWDHIVVAEGTPVADPWVTLGAIAQATERITTGPMVLAMPRHRPWVVARQAVSLDRLSGGRLVLGVGIGYPPEVEFGTFAQPTDDRVRADMLDEGLEILAGMWSGRPFRHHGRHYRVEETDFGPGPSGPIPIWVAGMVPHRRPFRRAARYDGVFPIRSDMGEMNLADLRFVLEVVEAERPDDRPFEVVIGGGRRSNDEYARLAEAGVTWYLGGPPMEPEPTASTLRWIEDGPDAYRAA